VLCGLVKRHESLKKYLKTILDQLPQYIETYPPEEKKMLREFLSVLSHYGEADFKREELGNKLDSYRQKIISQDNFVILPFYWFVETYFRNAYVSLSVSKFHSESFYEYVVKHLRGNFQTKGAFKLIQTKTSLSNLKWEELQYECNKLTTPLTKDQLRIIDTVYSCIKELGVQSLDSKRLRTEIVKKTNQPSSTKDLHRFFKLIDGQWAIEFFSSAFGLDRYFFHLQMEENEPLGKIIDFSDPINTVLGLSDVHYVRDSKKIYYGTIYVPSRHMKGIKSFLAKHVSTGSLKLKEFSKIKNIYSSNSLTLYQEDKGWVEARSSKIKRLTQLLFSPKTKNKQMNKTSLQMSPGFNNDWNLKIHPLHLDIIKLYCKIPQYFSFINLPFDSTLKKLNQNLSVKENGLLKQLIYNRVANISFTPWRLVYDFSLDLYVIILPRIPLIRVKHFLDFLPFSEMYITEASIIIWARLTKKLASWIEQQLKWDVKAVLRANYPLALNIEWFDEETLQWKTPNVLN